MKKKLFVLLVAVVFGSCSQDSDESANPMALETSLSVLDGKMLSFKDDKSFIKEYSQLSELKSTKEIQGWISKKGHDALLNYSEASEGIQDSIIDNTRIIYSDALKAIVNSDSKFMVDGKVIWLNERTFYLLNEENSNKNIEELLSLKNNLNIYASLSSRSAQKNSQTNRTVPNENRSKDWVQYFNNSNRRLVLVLFNETIKYSNQEIFSSKMFLYTAEQYKSCSFWRCTWKTNPNSINTLTSTFGGAYGWTGGQASGTFDFANGTTILLATNIDPSANYNCYFSVNTSVLYGSFGYNWSQLITWYPI